MAGRVPGARGGGTNGGGGDGSGGPHDHDATATVAVSIVPTTILDSGAVAATDALTELTLTEDLAAGWMLELQVEETPGAIGYIFSDAVLGLAESASAPSKNSEDVWPVKVHRRSDDNFGHDSIYIGNSDEADKIWAGAGRDESLTLTIRAYKLSGTATIDVEENDGGGGSGDGGGGGGGGAGLQDLPDPLTADHVGNFYKRGGEIVRVETEYHAGHSREVETQSLDDYNGAAQRFLGFHRRVDSLQHGEFYLSTLDYNSFEIRLVNGEQFQGSAWTGLTGIYDFNPFEDGAIWHEFRADDASPYELTDLSGADPIHDTVWGNHAVHGGLNAVDAAIDEVGRVIVDIDNSSIEVATHFVAGLDSHTTYVARVWRPPGYGGSPRAYYWGKGQAERSPSNYPNADNGQAIRRLAFASAAPNETFDGWPYDDIFVDAADVSSDIDAGGPALTDLMVFTLPAGVYDIEIHIALSAVDTSAAAGLVEVMSGTDDRVVGDRSDFTSATVGLGGTLGTTYLISATDFVSDGTQQLYVGGASWANSINTQHWMLIQKKG